MADPNVEKWEELKAKLKMAETQLEDARNALKTAEDKVQEALGLVQDVSNIPPGTFPAITD